MPKVNGWKRIGIIASVLWMFVSVAYIGHQWDEKNDFFIQQYVDSEAGCPRDGAKHDICQQGIDRDIDSLVSPEAMAALHEDMMFWAFVPIPFAWLGVYFMLFLVRWVKRGFQVQL
jgi:hypothetical protein